jgi:hypothetical protein
MHDDCLCLGDRSSRLLLHWLLPSNLNSSCVMNPSLLPGFIFISMRGKQNFGSKNFLKIFGSILFNIFSGKTDPCPFFSLTEGQLVEKNKVAG